MVDYPEWDEPSAIAKALSKIKDSNTINGIITSKPIQLEEIALVENPPMGNTIELMVKTFVKCRVCDKTAGYVVALGKQEQEFECMACYEDESNE